MPEIVYKIEVTIVAYGAIEPLISDLLEFIEHKRHDALPAREIKEFDIKFTREFK